MNDSVRTEKTDDYIKKVSNEALKQFKKNVDEKKLLYYRKMCDALEAYFSNEKKLVEEAEKNMKALQDHKDDIKYYEEQAVNKVVDIAYMECIRTLTYRGGALVKSRAKKARFQF